MTWESSAEAIATAPPCAVWRVLLDGRRWSLWNPGAEWMWIEGEPVPGTLATIKLKRVRQTAFVIEESAAPRRFTIGLAVGPLARLRLSWTFTEHEHGTRVQSVVAIEGVAARLLLLRPARRLARAMPSSLERLARFAESVPDA